MSAMPDAPGAQGGAVVVKRQRLAVVREAAGERPQRPCESRRRLQRSGIFRHHQIPARRDHRAFGKIERDAAVETPPAHVHVHVELIAQLHVFQRRIRGRVVVDFVDDDDAVALRSRGKREGAEAGEEKTQRGDFHCRVEFVENSRGMRSGRGGRLEARDTAGEDACATSLRRRSRNVARASGLPYRGLPACLRAVVRVSASLKKAMCLTRVMEVERVLRKVWCLPLPASAAR